MKPNQALQRMTTLVTNRAPSRKSRAKQARSSAQTFGKHMKAFAVLLVLFFLVGCSSPGFSEDPKVAARQIEKSLPLGTSKVNAEQTLTASHILYEIKQGAFGNEHFPNYIYIDYFENDDLTVKRWQIAVILESDKVSGYRINYKLIVP